MHPLHAIGGTFVVLGIIFLVLAPWTWGKPKSTTENFPAHVGVGSGTSIVIRQGDFSISVNVPFGTIGQILVYNPSQRAYNWIEDPNS